MKSLKLVLIAAIVACVSVNLAKADGIKAEPQKSVNITFAEAVQNPALVVDMHKQLNPEFLGKYQPLYLKRVIHNNVVYNILGSRQQWAFFFNLQHTVIYKTKLRPNAY